MKEEIVLLLNRGEPKYYPSEFTVANSDDFFRNSFNFCWFPEHGSEPVLFSENSRNQNFLRKISGSGLLLVYDGIGIGFEPVNYPLIGNVLKKAIPADAKIYVCCHASKYSQPIWQDILGEHLNGRVTEWTSFRNDGIDPKLDILFGYLKKEIKFSELKEGLFSNHAKDERVIFIDNLRLIVLQGREDGTTQSIKKFVKTGNHLLSDQKRELMALLKGIDKHTPADAKWSELFNFLDKL